MVGTVLDLKPCHSRAARVDRSSQLIWVEPKCFHVLNQIKRRASHVFN